MKNEQTKKNKQNISLNYSAFQIPVMTFIHKHFIVIFITATVLMAVTYPSHPVFAMENVSEASRDPKLSKTRNVWVMTESGGGIFEVRHRMIRGYGSFKASGGYRLKDTGVLVTASYDIYTDPLGYSLPFGVLHFGTGLDKLWFQERVRGSFAFGISRLVTNTSVDKKGSNGFFVSIRPAAFRWSVGERWILELTPVQFDMSIPVLSGIPLVLANYSTTVGLELRI